MATVGAGLLVAGALGSTALAEHSVVELVSSGSTGGNGAFGVQFAGSSRDGARVFFHTDESLESGDTDSSQDIYERSGGTTTVLSIGSAGGAGAFGANFVSNSQDGTRVFFNTSEQLESSDTDAQPDLYERMGGTTTLISTGPAGGNGAFGVANSAISADGTRVVFVTDESLVGADTDSREDVYERSGGATTLISTGPIGGNGVHDAALAGASQDGTRQFFTTSESLAANDGDSSSDIYAASIAASPPGGGAPAPGGGSDGGPQPATKDTLAPGLKLGGAPAQRVLKQGGVVVVVECDEICSATATGTVPVSGQSKTFRLTKVTKTLAPRAKTKLKLKFGKKGRKALARALKRGKRLTANVSVTASDASGNSRSAKRKIKLRR